MTNFTHNSFLCIYFNSLHVSSNLVLITRRINCINTTSGICHSVSVTILCAGLRANMYRIEINTQKRIVCQVCHLPWNFTCLLQVHPRTWSEMKPSGQTGHTPQWASVEHQWKYGWWFRSTCCLHLQSLFVTQTEAHFHTFNYYLL